jgi:hypothetical protein
MIALNEDECWTSGVRHGRALLLWRRVLSQTQSLVLTRITYRKVIACL